MDEQVNTNPNQNAIETTTSSPPTMTTYQTFIIIILVILLSFSLLGINIFYWIGNLFQTAFDVVGPITGGALSDLGESTGKIIDESADIITETGKSGLDIVNGTFHSIGDLLIKGNKQSHHKKEPEPTESSNPIQTKESNTKWCLVGEYKERKGCVEISESDKCLSGKIFPAQHLCLNSGDLKSDGQTALPPTQIPT